MISRPIRFSVGTGARIREFHVEVVWAGGGTPRTQERGCSLPTKVWAFLYQRAKLEARAVAYGRGVIGVRDELEELLEGETAERSVHAEHNIT